MGYSSLLFYFSPVSKVESVVVWDIIAAKSILPGQYSIQ